jgi:hypothetical protein
MTTVLIYANADLEADLRSTLSRNGDARVHDFLARLASQHNP